jgi:hypothetical protein
VLAPVAPRAPTRRNLAYMHKYETRSKGAMREVPMQYDAKQEHPKHNDSQKLF